MEEEKEGMGFEEILDHCRIVLTEAGKFARSSETIGASLPDAKRSFFGAEIEGDFVPRDKSERFLEWFLLERRIPGASSPFSLWFSQKRETLEPQLLQMAACLESSLVGIFKIAGIQKETMEIEDSQGRGGFTLLLPKGEHIASVGDTLVGRIVPHPKTLGLFFAMGSAQVLQGDDLYLSVSREKRPLQKGSGDTFTQLELERILEMRSAPKEGDLIKARKALRSFLSEESELPSLEIVEEALRSVSSPGKVLDPLLEAVAFYTKKDIGVARRLGLQLWNALQVEGGSSSKHTRMGGKKTEAQAREDLSEISPSTDPDLPLGQRVLQELEAGEARGEDLESLFNRLGKMVNLRWEEGENSIPKKVLWSTPEVGDLGALIQEFRWEIEREGEPLSEVEEEILLSWGKSLQEEGEAFLGGVARLKWAQNLLSLWLQKGSKVCREGISLLTKFSKWLEETQEIRLDFPTKGFLEVWDRNIARCEGIQKASDSFPQNHEKNPPSIAWFVRGREGNAWILEAGTRRLTLPADLSLEVGDRIFGRPLTDSRTLEEGFRILPSCLALLAMEE